METPASSDAIFYKMILLLNNVTSGSWKSKYFKKKILIKLHDERRMMIRITKMILWNAKSLFLRESSTLNNWWSDQKDPGVNCYNTPLEELLEFLAPFGKQFFMCWIGWGWGFFYKTLQKCDYLYYKIWRVSHKESSSPFYFHTSYISRQF